VSPTFHGRDVFAPAAAVLAGRIGAYDERAGEIRDYARGSFGARVALRGALPWGARPAGEGRVVHIDRFGNLISDLPLHEAGEAIAIGGRTFTLQRAYEDVAPGARVEPPCEYFRAGCGGCQWQHVARAAQLAAKQAIVANALRKLPCAIEPIAAPAPPYGWRRRARFHVAGGKLGLYREGT